VNDECCDSLMTTLLPFPTMRSGALALISGCFNSSRRAKTSKLVPPGPHTDWGKGSGSV
jgi:hypothetical protein